MNNRLLRLWLVVVFSLAPIPAAAQAKSDPWYGPSSRPRDFEPTRAPSTRFAIELPKGWQIIPGHGAILFTATDRPRNNISPAAIVLEHIQLRSAVEVNATVAEVELTSIREREPSGKDFSQEIKNVGGRQFIFIQYTRLGLTAAPDRVVQYSVLSGSVLYRLICIAPAAQIAKYQSIFAHVAASFKANQAAAN